MEQMRAMDPRSDDTNYADSEVEDLQDLDLPINLVTIKDGNVKRLHARSLSSLVRYSNVSKKFLPLANAVIVCAMEIPDGKLRTWHVNNRFKKLYKGILVELLVGLKYNSNTLYEEFVFAIIESSVYSGMAKEYLKQVRTLERDLDPVSKGCMKIPFILAELAELYFKRDELKKKLLPKPPAVVNQLPPNGN